MSIAAMTWAFAQALKPSSLKFLLVALADNADDQGRAFPSIECLVEKTSQDRKTVISGLDRLEELKLATDTGSRVGKTKQVKVYRLERFLDRGNSTVNGIVEGPANSPVNGTDSETGTVPNFPGKGTVFPPNSTVFPPKGSRKRNPESSLNHQEPSGNLKSRAQVRARSRRAPTDFTITDDLRTWAKQACPNVDIDRETESFRDHEYRDPRSDWPAAWRTWMRRAPEFKRANGVTKKPQKDAPTTAELEALEAARAGH
jgi:hypothetical protein